MDAARAVSPDKPLTARQKDFAMEIAKGNSVPVALARAGFSDKDNSLGYRMIKMPNICRVIDAERAKFEADNQMSRRKVMDMLLESYDMAKLAAEPATMVSAAREIGKMCGYYEPRKIQVDIGVSGQTFMGRMNALSDAELMRLIEGGQAQGLLEGPQDDQGL